MSYKLGEYLKELRGKRSLREISKMTGGKLSHSYISDLEKGVSRRGNTIKPSPESLQTLADVYSVSYETLMKLAGYIPSESKLSEEESIKKEHYYNLTNKEELDIAHMAEKMLQGMDTNASVNFYGEPMTDDQKESMRDIIEMGLRINKEKAKKKFTPKKYRDDSGD